MQELVNFLHLKNRKIVIFLDYDGTLTEIVDDPSQAILTDDRKQLLIKINSKPNIELIVISGRSIEELDKVSNHFPIKMLGNHGLFY